MNIIKPTLLVDKNRAMRNIGRMAEKAKKNGVRFKPHFKTHQSAEIGEWFRQAGITSITVSSADMAEYFAAHGWHNITLAFPLNRHEIKKINLLAQTIDLHLLIESEESAHFLNRHLLNPVKVWMKIDSGYHRTGLLWDDFSSIQSLCRAIRESDKLSLQGLLTHAGHSYQARSAVQAREIYRESVERMNAARRHAQEALPDASLDVSVGDTPGCSTSEDFGHVEEIRPGNFVFYDLMQLEIGSCAEEDIALAVGCPVVSKHPERQELVIYGGAIHLSKESLNLPAAPGESRAIYGRVALPKVRGWGSVRKGSAVVRLSQEHGIIKADPELFERIAPGDILIVIPVHSCLTVNLLRHYQTLAGERIDIADLT